MSEWLINMWCICLNTDQRTLKDTTQKCIRTMGILAKRFETDKAQIW